MLKLFFYSFLAISVIGCKKSTGDGSFGIQSGNLAEYVVSPDATDPSITADLNNHYVYIDTTGPLKNTLVVFLPGTGAEPKNYRGIVQEAAGLGYHAIGLMYVNDVLINGACSSTNDITCHSNARREIIDGIDRSQYVSVDPSNSIMNRLVKLLEYLQNKYPSQNWGQFLNGGQPNWPKIIVAGHSQGGGNAAVIGVYYPVKRAIIFSDIDFLANGSCPDWENKPASADKIFTIIHPEDELIKYNYALSGWQNIGLTNFGNVVNVDSATYPYSNSHTLITRIQPAFSSIIQFHNSTVVDLYVPKDASGNYIFLKAWQYLLGD
ncbi:MAG: hypothetical protein JST87_12530 [Bacteroidetes bacterium]|nr:hypothetical protein [Bacteroidota bacterium]